MKLRGMAVALALALGSVAAGSASAATYYLNDGGGAFGDQAFGTVTVTGSATDLHFDVLLNSPFQFITTGSHVTFAGNLGGTIGGLVVLGSDNVNSTNFTFSSTLTPTIPDSPFGGFDFSLDCKTGSSSAPCGQNGGGGHPFGNELIFDISGTGLSVLPATPDGSKPIYFAADIVNTTNGNTGVVGATGSNAGVPEPATWGLMIAGFGAIGAAMRQRRRAVVPA